MQNNLPALFLAVVAVVAAGCASTPKAAWKGAGDAFPAEGVVTQRGVLTVMGRQFTLNGQVALSPTGGRRLILMEGFGAVLADVLVKPDGTARVMRASGALKPKWIEQHVAADVRCLFGAGADCPVEQISATHFVVKRRWYKLDLQTVATKAGPQPAAMFEP